MTTDIKKETRQQEEVAIILEEVLDLVKKGIDPSNIVNTLRKLDNGNLQGESKAEEKNIQVVISEFLTKIGMPAHLKGYKHAREAIIYMISNGGDTVGITKDIYPGVAKKFDTTSSRIERSIRHAIEVTWDRGDIYLFDKCFGISIDPQRGKPTNLEFIATVTEMYLLGKI